MLFAGIDLHKQSITVCVMNPACQIVSRKRLAGSDEAGISNLFRQLGEFRAVVEATASYE